MPATSPAWEVLPSSPTEYGLFARKPIKKGQKILLGEGLKQRIVSRSHAEQHWNARQLEFFRRTARPITDELYAAWSSEPDEWKPINHSCDPNAWFEGLDIVARRRIKKGEEITLDYATFYNEQAPSFECNCASPECRGTFRGDDYLRDFVASYGDHVSNYVRSKRVNRETQSTRSAPQRPVSRSSTMTATQPSSMAGSMGSR